MASRVIYFFFWECELRTIIIVLHVGKNRSLLAGRDWDIWHKSPLLPLPEVRCRLRLCQPSVIPTSWPVWWRVWPIPGQSGALELHTPCLDPPFSGVIWWGINQVANFHTQFCQTTSCLSVALSWSEAAKRCIVISCNREWVISARLLQRELGTSHSSSSMQWRFALLCLAALEAPLNLKIGGTIYGEEIVFVSNDWQGALTSVYLAGKYRPHNVYHGARTVIAIHNLRHQVAFYPATHQFLHLNQVPADTSHTGVSLKFGSPLFGKHSSCIRMGCSFPMRHTEMPWLAWTLIQRDAS